MSDEHIRLERQAASAPRRRRGRNGDLEARPARRDLRPLTALTPFVRAHRADAILAGVFLTFSTAATLGVTFAARLMADKGLASHAAGAIDSAFLVLGGVVAFLAAATAGRFYFITKLGERVVADLREALYAHVLTLDPAFFSAVRTGEVLSRMTTDLTIVETMLGSSVSVALRNLLTVVGALVVLVVVNPGLTGFVVLLAVLILAPLIFFGRRVRALSSRAQDRFAEAVGYAGETLDALDTVQAFGREQLAATHFRGAVEEAFRASLARIGARAGMTFLVMLLVACGIGLVLWRASLAVFVDHTMTAGGLLQFVFLSALAAGSAGSLSETWGDVQKASGAMQRIKEILDARATILSPPHPQPLPEPPQGSLTLDNVVFAYPDRPDLRVLDGFSLSVAPGERVALVGPSGAGKSTVFRLLLRFYDPQSGVVRIDGVDVRQADAKQVRRRMALVAQDAPLFSGSALDNLRFGREEASRQEILDAAAAAQASGFLAALPHGLDTPLGERAKTLSGGQRQRLAIARALLRTAPILLLDEATSALDAENEHLVQKALREAMIGRTTLVIAHRLATVLGADRIAVVDGGRVVEMGRHAELLERGGLYARLAKMQFGLAAA